jgi:hypothetical protein
MVTNAQAETEKAGTGRDYLSIYLSIYVSIYVSIYLSIYLSIDRRDESRSILGFAFREEALQQRRFPARLANSKQPKQGYTYMVTSDRSAKIFQRTRHATHCQPTIHQEKVETDKRADDTNVAISVRRRIGKRARREL